MANGTSAHCKGSGSSVSTVDKKRGDLAFCFACRAAWAFWELALINRIVSIQGITTIPLHVGRPDTRVSAK
jgi:hypothetical protein